MTKPYEIIGEESTVRIVRVTCSHPMFAAALVPYGYECDGASIPRWLWPICGDPFSEPRVIAAIVHDWMYEQRVVGRKTADRIYLENLINLGVPKLRAYTEYVAVRLFGGKHWRT